MPHSRNCQTLRVPRHSRGFTQKKLLNSSNNEGAFVKIDQLPTHHHKCYLATINKKLTKYAHDRKFKNKKNISVSANFGLVHHFNLGDIKGNNVLHIKTLITLLDYFRFYKNIYQHDNVDLKNSENLILSEIAKDNPKQPFLLLVGRNSDDLPCLFNMLHITAIKNETVQHFALIVLSISLIENSDGSYPVHRWFLEMISHPKSKKYFNDSYKENKIQINISSDIKLF